jgi:hypothetical protein
VDAGRVTVTTGVIGNGSFGTQQWSDILTNSATKTIGLSMPHFTNSTESNFGVFSADATTSANTLYLGTAGTSSQNAATQIEFWTAATTTGGIGTRRGFVSSGAWEFSENVTVVSAGGPQATLKDGGAFGTNADPHIEFRDSTSAGGRIGFTGSASLNMSVTNLLAGSVVVNTGGFEVANISTSAITLGRTDSAMDLVLTAPSAGAFDILHGVSNGTLNIHGGSISGSGVRIEMSGTTHATTANDFRILSGSHVVYHYDDSASAIQYGHNTSYAHNFIGNIRASDGTEAAPSISWTSDTDTGLFRTGTNTFAFVNGGANSAIFSATGFDILAPSTQKLRLKTALSDSTGFELYRSVGNTILNNATVGGTIEIQTGGVKAIDVTSSQLVRFVDGSDGAPSISFQSGTTLGFYRVGSTSTGVSGVLALSDGTAAAPGGVFASDLDSGIFRVGPNNLGFATGGISAMSITSLQALDLLTHDVLNVLSLELDNGVSSRLISPTTEGVSFGSTQIENVTDPDDAQDVATKAYVDNVTGFVAETTLTTTTNAITEIHTFLMDNNTSYFCKAKIVAFSTNTSNQGAFEIDVVAFRRSAGVCNITGTTLQLFAETSDQQWDADFVCDSNNLDLRVNGDTAETVNWRANISCEKAA